MDADFEEKEDVEIEAKISQALEKAQADIDKFTKNDKEMRRKDTVEVMVDIMSRIKTAGNELNEQTEEERERLYYLTFNATILIFRICSTLRVAGYPKEATHYLAFNVLCLDNNLILTTVKYLDWRVLNYVELGRAYADLCAYKAASKVIEYGLTKVLYTKKIEEQDLPVPDGAKDTLTEALRVLRTQEIKYQLQQGTLTADTWKKKVEETFALNKYHRSLAIVECLSMNDVANCHLVQRNAKHLKVKGACLKLAVDMLKGDVTLVREALLQIHDKKKRDREKKDKFAKREEEDDLDELLDKYKALEMEMIKEKDWKFASYNVPIEVHVELLKLCYESEMWTEFDLLLDPALVRLKFRRYEVPYLATVDIQMSATKISNIPNGFEKLPKDLNAANLRIELKKHRASNQKSGGGDSEPAGGAKTAAKKEEKKAAPPKADPKKKDAKGKDAPVTATQESEKFEDEEQDDVIASQKELEYIQHIYVYMLLQRTKNSQNAIVGIDVVLADEDMGPELPDSHFAVAVPIRQHPGAYEKTGLIPYIVFRRTANSLIDEEDQLSIITDVQILQGQDRHLRPPLGYVKIPVDLRQTPEDLERVPNLDYVFVCYKTDKQVALVERDLLIFRRLNELERSIVPRSAPGYKELSEEARFLMTTYDLQHLTELSRTMREALLGPLGDYYIESRRDILSDLSCELYGRYLLPVLQRIDIYVEMRNQKEFFGELVDQLDEHVIRVKNLFVEVFNVIHRVMTRESFVDNIILYSKFSIYYANLLEETGDFRSAVQGLRGALGKLVEWRENRLKSTLDSQDSLNASMSITIDNKKVGELENKISRVTETWRELILRKERDRERREQEKDALDEDEGDEEQEEERLVAEELHEKNLFEKQIDSAEWHKESDEKNKNLGKRYFSEQDQIVHALHCDLLVCLYRCEVKLGKEMTVVKNQTNSMLTQRGMDLAKNAPGNMTKNLSGSLSKKMNQPQSSKSLASSKSALKDLQHTLQEAGKLPPAKPQALHYEKILQKENNQNPYQNTLLYMSLAVTKNNAVAQKSLLLEALDNLKRARKSEEDMGQLAVESAVSISASRHFHSYYGKTPSFEHPYSLLAKSIYIKKTPVPLKPIMICRTSTSITMKLPFYKPITEYKSWRNISKVALYGKPSGSGVAVSLNNTDYDGTGEKHSQGHIVHVTGLIQNEKYVFAAGGYTADGICVNGIGETCKDILTLMPLSLHQLSGYLAEIAFKLGHFTIAKQAAEAVCTAFVVKNEHRFSMLDARVNPVLAFRLNMEYLQLVSPIEAKQVAEAFIILARVSKIVKNDVQKLAEVRELKVDNQKIDMKIANYLVIALDIAMLLNMPVLVKKVCCELFNHLVSYFQMEFHTPLLFQITLKCHQAFRLIPSELVDATSRRVLACLSFQLVRTSLQTNEESMLRRVMLSELPLNSRKWRKYSQFVIQKPELSEEDQKKMQEQKDKIAAGEEIPESELIVQPEEYEEKQFKMEEFEVEGNSFEELLLSLGNYTDVVRAKTQRWKDLLSGVAPQITSGAEVTDLSKDMLQQIVEFWEGIKTGSPLESLTKLLANSEKSKRHLEFACKCVRRAMEMPDVNLDELAELLENKISASDEIQEDVLQLLAKRGENLENDRVEKQRKRFELLEEKIQKRLEQKSLGGNFTGVQTKKLQKMTEGGVIEIKDMKSQQMVTFASEEEEQARVYDYLWISERYYLKGICLFLSLAQSMNNPEANQSGPRMLNHSTEVPLNCVFNDILRLDFTKFQQVLKEHGEVVKEDRRQWDDLQQRNKEAEEDKEETEVKEKEVEEEEYFYGLEDRVHKMTAFLEVMAQAAKFALNSKSWLQLVSIINYTWNAVSYDLTTPLDLMHSDGWKDFVIIAECGLYLLEFLQKGGKLRQMAGQCIDQVKNQKTAVKGEGKTVAFKFDAESEFADDEGEEAEKPAQGGVSGKGPKWYDYIDEFDINIQSSFIGYAMQNLMCVGKWESLVDLANRLNNASEKKFASQLLPFIIYAQATLFDKANDNTKNKRTELQDRIQSFENWKLTNKKKRSRQAMITGEIPEEEQTFLDDKAKLEKEIFRLEVIESVLQGDKDSSHKLLEDIKRDANNCDEWLGKCRELYSAYGIATEQLREDELKKACAGVVHIDNYEIKLRRKSHKVATNIAVQNYKKCIDLLRKRQENFLLIQALHELGNIHYADGNLSEAEVQWNDCIDTIFQQLYVVAEFRAVFKKNPFLADSFGSRQVLIGGIVLTKLAKLCYEGKNLQKFSECTLMAAELFAAPSKLRFPHPQTAIQHADYVFREYFNGRVAGEDAIFVDKQIIQPNEVLHTVHVVAQNLIDMERFDQAVPLCALMEYVAQIVTKSKVLSTKARITKAIALVETGYINEAYQIFRRVIELRDLPKHGTKESLVSSRNDGNNFYFDRETSVYFNELTPDHEKNQAAIEYLSKPIEGQSLNDLKKFCSPTVVEMVQYLRTLFLVRLGECENTGGNEKAGLREKLLGSAEESGRTILRNLQLIEEVSSINNQTKVLQIREIARQPERVRDLASQLEKTFDAFQVPEVDQKGFFVSNTEEEMSEADARSQTLSFLLRTRFLLGRVFRKQGLLINAFYVLRQGLVNFKLLAEGETRGVESGEETKEKGSFKLPEMFGGAGAAGANAAAKGGKAPPPKAADPKAKGAAAAKGKGDGDAGAQEEAKNKREEEERNARLSQEREQMRLAVEADPKRKHPHMLLWLKAKVEIITILFYQKRMEDVQDSIAITKLECLNIKDKFFTRQLDEVDFMMQVAAGDRASALNKGREIMAHAKQFTQMDQSYTEFLGNLSELMYNIDKSEEAAEVIKEGRLIAWYRLRDQGIEIDQQNINGLGDVNVDSQRKKIDDGAVSQFATQVPAAGKDAKGKGAPAKGKPDPKAEAAKGAEEGSGHADDGEGRRPLNFGRPVQYELVPADEEINSSKALQNIYLQTLPMAIRFDIRFAQYCIMISEKLEMAKKILTDTLKLIQRTLFPSSQLIFYCSFLLGLANLRIFEQQVIQFQARYKNERKYRQKLADHIPHDYFALGEFMIELPNFSSQLRKSLKGLLNEAKEHFRDAVRVGKNECVLYEFDFTLRDALQGLSEVHFLLGEYRQRSLEYKYAAWETRDMERRVARRKELMLAQENPTNDDLDDYKLSKELAEEQDKWEEEKESRELLDIHNHRRASVHYLQAAIAVSDSQVQMNDKQHEIGQTNLTSMDKLPREVASELFQASQVSKVVTQKLAGFEFKEKTAITASEVLAYLKSIVHENSFFTFGQESERLSKLITKLHKYLKVALPSYQAKCVGEVGDYTDITTKEDIAKNEIIQTATTVSSWTDFQNSKSYMFYVLGPLDVELLEAKKEEAVEEKQGMSARTIETPEEKAALAKEQATVHFGRVEADPVALSKLHQDVRDLADKMAASEKLTEEQNERDRRGYQKDLENLIDRLGGFFKPPILSEEFADQDVNCLSLVKDCLPPLSIENIMKFADILKKEAGCTKKDPYFNAVLRKFHRIRYAK